MELLFPFCLFSAGCAVLESPVAAELVVADPAAAHPAPEWRILAGESWRHEGGGALVRRSRLLFFGRLLHGRNDQPDFKRRDRDEFLIDQSSLSHEAVQGRPAFAEQVLDSVALLQKPYRPRQVDQTPLACDDKIRACSALRFR